MDNFPQPQLPNPVPPAVVVPAVGAHPCTNLGLALYSAPVRVTSPTLAPVPNPTISPASFPNPTVTPDPVAEPSSSSAPAAAVATSIPEHLMHKNKLQEYTQKSSLALPVYQTFNEGSPHTPKFRSTVWVDGVKYTSPNTFLHRKAVEQDVAKFALESILKKVKEEGCPLLHEDVVFCKSILNEFAVKVNQPMPTYNTTQLSGLLPTFTSTLVFDGVSYNGGSGKNKKEAEQLAARTAIVSLLGNSGFSKTLYEIIRSKRKLYVALDEIKRSSNVSSNSVPVGVSTEQCPENTVCNDQEVRTDTVTDAVPIISTSAETSGVQPPHHPLKRLQPDLTPETIPFPITFVHSTLEQPQGMDVGSSSAKKRRKNKKRAIQSAQ